MFPATTRAIATHPNRYSLPPCRCPCCPAATSRLKAYSPKRPFRNWPSATSHRLLFPFRLCSRKDCPSTYPPARQRLPLRLALLLTPSISRFVVRNQLSSCSISWCSLRGSSPTTSDACKIHLRFAADVRGVGESTPPPRLLRCIYKMRRELNTSFTYGCCNEAEPTK